MITFIIALALLIGGYMIYGRFVNNVFGPDNRETPAVTNEDGAATVRGFYGNYDVTVTHNGKTKTVMAAFHKGYDNVLEFVIE